MPVLKNKATRASSVALLLVLLALLSACAINPVTGQEQLSFMSEAQELELGRQYYPQTTQMNNGLPADDTEVQGYVKNVGNKLAKLSHRPSIPWEFNVVNSSQINAFALPGGKISITRGLITKMNSEDELASVLGHEIGHITARHQAEQYTNQVLAGLALAGLGVALASEEWGQYGVMAAGMAASLLMMSYSRDMERQADSLGYEYMTRAGYNPQGQVDTFELFLAEEKESPGAIAAFFRSHPLTDERIETARQNVVRTDPRLSRQPLKKSGFNRYLARQKQRAPAYEAMDKGDALMSRKQAGNAVNEYRKAINIHPKEGLFHTKLSMALSETGQHGQALKEARMGSKLNPGLFLAHHTEGMLWLKGKRYKEAGNAYARAQRLMPQSAENTIYLAYCQERMGMRNQAVSLYRRSAQMAPGTWVAETARKRLAAMGLSW